MEPDKSLADLGHYTGTENWHRYMGRYLVTDGVKYVADNAGAYWLLDVVFSHQLTPEVRREEFQVWTLTVDLAKQTGVVVATDGGKGGRKPKEIARQEIPYTDFPRAEMVFWLEGGTLILPSEH